MKYEEIIREYQWIKENIKYHMSYWGDTARTLATRRGHCAMKAELLASRLRAQGIEVRFVEVRPSGARLPISRLPVFDAHFWLEARVNDKWLTLDATPDSGIVGLAGDTIPGSRLGRQGAITYYEEIPLWYKRTYNHPLVAPLRWLTNLHLARHRLIAGKGEKRQDSPTNHNGAKSR